AASSSAAAGDFLLALTRFEERAGNWSFEFGKQAKTIHGIFAAPIAEKMPMALRNPASNRQLYLTVTAAAKTSASSKGVQRHIFNLDGGETKGPLSPGATYLVLLEGAWPADDRDELVVTDRAQSLFTPLTCAIEAPHGENFLGWL